MVLLKNDGTLPLKQGQLKIAVVGPLADQTKYLLGNYNGTPTHTVSVLEGLRAEFPEAQINFVPGTQFLRADGDPVPASAFTNADGQPGLQSSLLPARYSEELPLYCRAVRQPRLILKLKTFLKRPKANIRRGLSGMVFLRPPETSDYSIGVRFQGGFARVLVEANPLRVGWGGDGVQAKVGHVHLEQGKKVPIKVIYSQNNAGPVSVS